MNTNQPYTSPEIESYRAPEIPDQKREEDPLTKGLDDIKNESKNPYEINNPINPSELQTGNTLDNSYPEAHKDNLVKPENDQESQPGDRDLLRNQKEILENARRTLAELGTLSSENNSSTNASELNSRLATALNQAELARQNPSDEQDHRFQADRLHVIDEMAMQGKELVATYHRYETKFKQTSEAFKKDIKEAMDDFERATEAGDADELAKKSALAVDKLKDDRQATNSLLVGFNAEVNAIYSKMDGLSSRYYSPTARMAEHQMGENQESHDEQEPKHASEQQESSDLMHGMNEFRSQSSEQVRQLFSAMGNTLAKQDEVIKRVEEIAFNARRNEVDGHNESSRRPKSERLDNNTDKLRRSW